MRAFLVISLYFVVLGCQDPETCEAGWSMLLERVEQEDCPQEVFQIPMRPDLVCRESNECAAVDPLRAVRAYLAVDPEVFCDEASQLYGGVRMCIHANELGYGSCEDAMGALDDRITEAHCQEPVLKVAPPPTDEVCERQVMCSSRELSNAWAAVDDPDDQSFCSTTAEIADRYYDCVSSMEW